MASNFYKIEQEVYFSTIFTIYYCGSVVGHGVRALLQISGGAYLQQQQAKGEAHLGQLTNHFQG